MSFVSRKASNWKATSKITLFSRLCLWRLLLHGRRCHEHQTHILHKERFLYFTLVFVVFRSNKACWRRKLKCKGNKSVAAKPYCLHRTCPLCIPWMHRKFTKVDGVSHGCKKVDGWSSGHKECLRKVPQQHRKLTEGHTEEWKAD